MVLLKLPMPSISVTTSSPSRTPTRPSGVPVRITSPQLVSALGPLVDHALGLPNRALDASRQRQQYCSRYPDITLDVLFQRLCRGLSRLLPTLGQLRAHFDVDGNFVQAAWPGDFEHIVGRKLRLSQDQILHLRRKNVDAPDD